MIETTAEYKVEEIGKIDNFDNVDFGIICGMIAHQHQIDLLDLANDQWGTCR